MGFSGETPRETTHRHEVRHPPTNGGAKTYHWSKPTIEPPMWSTLPPPFTVTTSFGIESCFPQGTEDPPGRLTVLVNPSNPVVDIERKMSTHQAPPDVAARLRPTNLDLSSPLIALDTRQCRHQVSGEAGRIDSINSPLSKSIPPQCYDVHRADLQTFPGGVIRQ